MADPALPPSFIRDFRALEERIKVLETANRLQASSIRGGVLTVLDDAGETVARVGRVGGVTDGFDLQDPDGGAGMMHVSSAYGWAIPYIGSSWSKTDDAVTVTSGSFLDVWTSRVEQNLSLHVQFSVYVVTTDPSTTAELKVTYSGATIGDTLSVGGSHAAYHRFSAATGGLLFAGPYFLVLQARRTAGSGNVFVYHPTDAYQGEFATVIAVTGWIS